MREMVAELRQVARQSGETAVPRDEPRESLGSRVPGR
jgi:hypothetical protein